MLFKTHWLYLRSGIMRQFILFTISFCSLQLHAQVSLPDITVKNYSGKIIVSWKNEYKNTVTAINIQRSYDSLKNYTTVGSVLNPLNRENGYADSKPPYNKMYYRLFISFEGGSYIFSNVERPVKEKVSDSISRIVPPDTPEVKASLNGWVASRRIYSGKENNIIINLPDAGVKKYSVKFFDDKDEQVFEIKKIPETYLILERVNFVHAGWFRYELYENGKLADANKFYVFKDAKPQQAPPDPKGN